MEINSKSKIIMLFTICIIVRLLLTSFVIFVSNNTYKETDNYNRSFLYLVSLILLGISLGFLGRYLSYNKEDKGAFKTDVWWNNYRLFHFVTYFLAAVFLLSKKYHRVAYYILILDIIAGISFFTYNKVNS